MSTVEWYAHAIQCESPLPGLDLSGIFQTYIVVSPELNKYQLIFEVFNVLTQVFIMKQMLFPFTAYYICLEVPLPIYCTGWLMAPSADP